MLKFFRIIRWKLIDEENLRKYSIYAFGEIILVVIGILLALQINSWSQFKKDRSIERELLSDLKLEMESNLSQLMEKIVKAESKIERDSLLLYIILRTQKRYYKKGY
jgi:hypothetical protein